MKILITGSSGYIGTHFLKYLIKKKVKIVSIYRKKKPKIKSLKIKNLKFNIFGNKKFLNKNKIDLLIHFAWEKKNYSKSKNLDEAKKHLKFLKTIVDSGVKNIVVAGSCFEYGKKNGSLKEESTCNPNTNYGIQKKFILDNIIKYQKLKKFNLVWLRIFYIFGGDQPANTLYGSFVEAKKNKKSFNTSKGNQLRDYIHINNLCRIIFKIIKNKKKDLGIINLCSGKPKKVISLIKSWNTNNKVKINRGYYQYPEYEGLNFWGSNKKLNKIIK